MQVHIKLKRTKVMVVGLRMLGVLHSTLQSCILSSLNRYVYVHVSFKRFFKLNFQAPVAQLVKNPPAMMETWVRFLGWEDPLEKRKTTPSSIQAYRTPWTV